VDHNEQAVAYARALGLEAYLPDEFIRREQSRNQFDSLLIAHVLEHMEVSEGVSLLRSYAPFVKNGGRVVVICPQERGYATDSTHVTFQDERSILGMIQAVGCERVASYSFPFPRLFGRLFTYNEFVVVGRFMGAAR